MQQFRLVGLLVVSLGLCIGSAARAADTCKERVEAFREKFEKDKDKYTLKSRQEAERHLLQAQLPSLNLFQCSEHLAKARQALREGKK
jgi:hypothetical protein